MLKLVILLLILSGMILLVLSIIAFQRRTSPLWLPFTVAAICAAIWNFGFAIEILSPTLEDKIFWANVQFIGIVFLPLAWLVMTLLATGQSQRTLSRVPFLGIVPLLTLWVAWTNPDHIFRQHPTLNTVGVPFPVLVNDYGFYFYAIHVPYNYLLFLASFYLLILSRRQGLLLSRRQRSIMIISLFLPLLVDTLYVLDVTPIPAFNFASTFFSVSALLMGFNVLKLHFLDIVPLAYEAAITEMDVGVIVLDSSGKVLHVNPAAERITATACEQALGKEAREIFPLLSPIWTSAQASSEIVVKQGENTYTYQVAASSIAPSRKQPVGSVITLVDVSERAALYRQVEQLSLTDPLTGALNRRALVRYGEQEIARAQRYQRILSLLLLDVDNFKWINDQKGHQFGDLVLKALVQEIRNLVRTTDLVFRYGGDEFVILLPETNAGEAYKTAERIHQVLGNLTLAEPYDGFFNVQVSIGVTDFRVGDHLDRMLQRADQALSQAKRNGKSQTILCC
jgi:diguanylate cyclase (GGDEF)-like protein/PAS domain S-box-containing protein